MVSRESLGVSEMGLGVSHDCWYGSYGRFNWWRNEIAKLLGYPTEKDAGLSDSDQWALPQELFAGNRMESTCMGEWPKGDPDDPIAYLMCHSDCDGKIQHRHTAPLAGRLEEILTSYRTLRGEAPGTGYGGTENFISRTEQFIAGLRAAHAAGENVEFG